VDYGPLGVELKENIKRQWWRSVVTAATTWWARFVDHPAAPGVGGVRPRRVFNDPLVESLITHKRYRATISSRPTKPSMGSRRPTAGRHPRPETGDPGQWTEPREFNMMLKTFLGPIETEEGMHYLRPETAQGSSSTLPTY